MKKIIYVIIIFCFILIILSSSKISKAYKNIPTICYDGLKKEIVFFNANGTDLFKNFKELMPGDKKEQDILLELDNINKKTKILLKNNFNNNSYLNLFKIIIYIDNIRVEPKNDYIEIGQYEDDKKINIKVILDIPNDLSTEINDNINIDWEFLVQEDENEIFEVPKTYDNTNINIWIILCIISFIISCISLICIKNINKKRVA